MPAKQQRSPSYEYLRDKWVKKHKELQGNLIDNHKRSFQWLSENTKQLAMGTLAASTILTSPIVKPQDDAALRVASAQAHRVDDATFVISDLSKVLPTEVIPLDSQQEASVSAILTRDFGLTTHAEINGLRLNRSYGLIGAEQHLARFPGDNMGSHFDGNQQQASEFTSSGMAPGLGAWGYFATSQAAMTQEDTEREKYYIAVQTFLSPDFNSKVAEYRDFYKYRKMLVVNPQNGKAMVVVIGDAGPAEWTGKHLGGSPEVMRYLERQDGRARGPVLYYFIDDPDDSIPLGPIKPISNQ